MVKDNSYSSIEEQRPIVSVEKGLTPVGDPEEPRSNGVKNAFAAITLIGSFLALVSHWSSRTEASTSRGVDIFGAQYSIPLPSYLTALDETDPEWDEHSWALKSKYVIGDPGNGNLIPDRVNIVRFNEPHFVFRTYGGDHKARQCGYWWVMEPPKESKETYFDHFAICPEWNDASTIIRCRVPEGYIAAVGEGQSVHCPDSGLDLNPDPANLQLNGNICTASVQMEKHLSCEYCSANAFDLELSACSNNGPNFVDGFAFGN